MDVMTPEQRSRTMSMIRSSGSKIERKLALSLWHQGYHYRKNDKSVFGKPDLTFKKHRIAIFVDSEFWHGKNWKEQRSRIKTNVDFWRKKIERNIQRDKEVNEHLERTGWTVIRFWGKQIEKELEECLETIRRAVEQAMLNETRKVVPRIRRASQTRRSYQAEEHGLVAAEPENPGYDRQSSE